MQRNFSIMLSLLLDAGVPEAKAVRLASGATANLVFMRRAERVVSDLELGVKLAEAVRWLDDSGEFRWRVRAAAHSQTQGGFLAALSGWHEVLDAKAFQEEQAASQILSTSVVLLNGLMAVCVTLMVFSILVSIMEEAPLW